MFITPLRKRSLRPAPKSRAYALPALAALAIFFAACGPKEVYRVEHKIEGASWAWEDTLRYCFRMTDTIGRYDMFLEVTHWDTFPYQNFYCQLHTRFPDGHVASVLKSYDLYDYQGRSRGRQGSRVGRVSILLQNDTWFNQQGEYCISLEQYTRDAQLGGITAVGLRIVEAKPED
ncbi:MAG: hypothetical protein ACK4NS_10355 [Saprospiraceae bacterium]